MNWGIIGYGEITPSFIEGLDQATNAKLIAIASKSAHKYLDKKELYKNINYYKSYKKLIALDSIDIIYIATTNNLHYQNTKLVLDSGKHCLCEKPFTPSENETQRLITLAKNKGLFLMEGMWTRFLPAYRKFIELLDKSSIGRPKLLKVDFGFWNDWPKNRRLLNPKLYGGTLLDNADYNVFLSQDVFREYPKSINAIATYAETGVEDACGIQLLYPNGGMAQLFSSFRCKTEQEAIVYGDKGYIKLKKYWRGTEIMLKVGEKEKKLEFPFRANGFEYQIESVQNSIAAGKIENDFVPHAASIEVAQILDEVQRQIQIHKNR